ncbi:MAG: hypothetical protein AAFZ15_01190 [Bacteroidota bacterium]
MACFFSVAGPVCQRLFLIGMFGFFRQVQQVQGDDGSEEKDQVVHGIS